VLIAPLCAGAGAVEAATVGAAATTDSTTLVPHLVQNTALGLSAPLHLTHVDIGTLDNPKNFARFSAAATIGSS
jgi:hypothetical protein